MFYRSDRFSFKSIHFKNPISLTLTNVLQIRKYRLFVPLLMFYRFESLGFASSQNVLQIRVARFCPLTKCSTDPTALTPIFLPLVKCSTDRDALADALHDVNISEFYLHCTDTKTMPRRTMKKTPTKLDYLKT